MPGLSSQRWGKGERENEDFSLLGRFTWVAESTRPSELRPSLTLRLFYYWRDELVSEYGLRNTVAYVVELVPRHPGLFKVQEMCVWEIEYFCTKLLAFVLRNGSFCTPRGRRIGRAERTN